MPFNTTKTVLHVTDWNKEYDEFVLQNNFTPSAKLLWQWLGYYGVNKELEPDLQKEFNSWVTKHRGKPFDPKTIKAAIKQLNDCNVLNIVRKYSWKLYRLFLKPLDWIKPKKKVRKSEQISKTHPSNGTSADEEVNNNNIIHTPSFEDRELQRRADIISLCEKYGYKDYPKSIFTYSVEQLKTVLDRWSKEQYAELERQHSILHLCAEYGIYFNPSHKNTQELFLNDLEDIKPALEYFVAKGGHETNPNGKPIIARPNGWLISCLRERWWEESSFGLAEFITAMTGFLNNNHIPRDYE